LFAASEGIVFFVDCDEIGFDAGFEVFDDVAADFGVFDTAVDELLGSGFELGFEHSENEGVFAGEVGADVGEDGEEASE